MVHEKNNQDLSMADLNLGDIVDLQSLSKLGESWLSPG